MKKAFLTMTCVLCLFATLAQTALAEQVTLSELKQQMPERLQMTVTTKDGKTIEVDAPIVLPDGDTIPMFWAQLRKMDVDNVFDANFYPDGDHFFGEDENYGYFGYVNNKDWTVSERFVPAKDGGEAGAIRVPSLEKTLDNNPLIWDAPNQLMQNLLSILGASDVDVRVLRQVAMSRPYKMQVIRNSKDADEAVRFAAKLDQPIKSREKGYYVTEYSQYLFGAQIFGEGYRLRPNSKYPTPENQNFTSPTLFIWSKMLSDMDFDVGILLLEPTEILSDDVTLASFHTVQKTIEKRIQAGELKHIQEIELGYQMICGWPYAAANNDFWENPSNQSYVLAPCWRIIGYDEKDRFDFKSRRVGDNPEMPTELDYAYMLAHAGMGSAPLTLRIDARSGAVVNGEDLYWEK